MGFQFELYFAILLADLKNREFSYIYLERFISVM